MKNASTADAAPHRAADTGCAEKLKVLADLTRLQVVRHLMAGPKRVGELNDAISIDQSLLSHHLAVLRNAGLVVTQRQGKSVQYALAPHVSGESDCINLGCCKLTF